MEKIGAAHKIEWVHEDDILQSSFQDKSYDFVWNFAYLPACPDPDKLIEEMKRISKKYVAVFSVNAGNIGFPVHRLVHKKTGIPWTHGDIRYNKRGFIRKRLEEHGLTNCGNRFCGLSGVAGFSGISGCETAQDECGF